MRAEYMPDDTSFAPQHYPLLNNAEQHPAVECDQFF
jgi:hypothetical protein